MPHNNHIIHNAMLCVEFTDTGTGTLFLRLLIMFLITNICGSKCIRKYN